MKNIQLTELQFLKIENSFLKHQKMRQDLAQLEAEQRSVILEAYPEFNPSQRIGLNAETKTLTIEEP